MWKYPECGNFIVVDSNKVTCQLSCVFVLFQVLQPILAPSSDDQQRVAAQSKLRKWSTPPAQQTAKTGVHKRVLVFSSDAVNVGYQEVQDLANIWVNWPWTCALGWPCNMHQVILHHVMSAAQPCNIHCVTLQHALCGFATCTGELCSLYWLTPFHACDCPVTDARMGAEKCPLLKGQSFREVNWSQMGPIRIAC